VCKIDCKKDPHPHGLNGTYRAIEISNNFLRGEFDFTFRESVDLMYHPADEVGKGSKWELQVEKVTPLSSGQGDDGAVVGFKVVKVSHAGAQGASAELKASGFNPSVGDYMKGLYATKEGQLQVTAFMYMALSLPSTSPNDKATSFDDGMNKLEFNMVACKDTSTCDFSSASVAPLAH